MASRVLRGSQSIIAFPNFVTGDVASFARAWRLVRRHATRTCHRTVVARGRRCGSPSVLDPDVASRCAHTKRGLELRLRPRPRFAQTSPARISFFYKFAESAKICFPRHCSGENGEGPGEPALLRHDVKRPARHGRAREISRARLSREADTEANRHATAPSTNLPGPVSRAIRADPSRKNFSRCVRKISNARPSRGRILKQTDTPRRPLRIY